MTDERCRPAPTAQRGWLTLYAVAFVTMLVAGALAGHRRSGLPDEHGPALVLERAVRCSRSCCPSWRSWFRGDDEEAQAQVRRERGCAGPDGGGLHVERRRDLDRWAVRLTDADTGAVGLARIGRPSRWTRSTPARPRPPAPCRSCAWRPSPCPPRTAPLRRRPRPRSPRWSARSRSVRERDYLEPVVAEPVTSQRIADELTDAFDATYPKAFYDRRTVAWQTIGVIPGGRDDPRGAAGVPDRPGGGVLQPRRR